MENQEIITFTLDTAALQDDMKAIQGLAAGLRQITAVLQDIQTAVQSIHQAAAEDASLPQWAEAAATAIGCVSDTMVLLESEMAGPVLQTGKDTAAVRENDKQAVQEIDTLINVLRELKFTVPDWIPGLGGQTMGFNIKHITAPQLPHLAKGAVLPANRLFLAVLGDQKHGTNVEAPLSVIQEAVANVTEDLVRSNLAGHEATVAVLQQILGAVLGIELDGEAISRAVSSYNRKMTVVRGG